MKVRVFPDSDTTQFDDPSAMSNVPCSVDTNTNAHPCTAELLNPCPDGNWNLTALTLREDGMAVMSACSVPSKITPPALAMDRDADTYRLA